MKLLSIIKGIRELGNICFGRHPSVIGLETDSLCNRRCAYCPNAVEMREREILSLGVIAKIVQNLKRHGYRGELHLHAFGEPLLDERIEQIIRLIRQTLP